MSAMASQLPEGPLVSWYGDDFTGSAAVMEVLSFAGLEAVLFLDIPTSRQSARFPDMRGIGIAGTARSHPPEWMKDNLPDVFSYLKSLNTPITHFKVCSTLDSSPEIGSIGCAIDLAQPIFNSNWVPLFVAAPAIRRFQCFGHVFASAQNGVFRLDRHPVMSRHPVTPMIEADAARHIQAQTNRKTSLIDLEMLANGCAADLVSTARGNVVSIDTVTPKDLCKVGDLIWNYRGDTLFAVGSQGIEYALVEHWRDTGQLALAQTHPGAGPCSQMVVVSGSVSETTTRQIEWASLNGFQKIRFDASLILEDDISQHIEETVLQALDALKDGKDPLVFSALGPDDPAVARFWTATAEKGIRPNIANNKVGQALGKILDQVLRRSNVSRAVISGGDTSGHATRQLGVYALTALAPTIPGAALFQAYSEDPIFQDLQLALKGGQMGSDDYFGWIKQGGGAAGKERKMI